jgi:hypothetical protein
VEAEGEAVSLWLWRGCGGVAVQALSAVAIAAVARTAAMAGLLFRPCFFCPGFVTVA